MSLSRSYNDGYTFMGCNASFSSKEHILVELISIPTLGVRWEELYQKYIVPIALDDASKQRIVDLSLVSTFTGNPLSGLDGNILHLEVPGLTRRQEDELLDKGRQNIAIRFEYEGNITPAKSRGTTPSSLRFRILKWVRLTYSHQASIMPLTYRPSIPTVRILPPLYQRHNVFGILLSYELLTYKPIFKRDV